MRVWGIVVVLLLLSPAVMADDWAYTLRPGDDLWTVARQYCGSTKRAEDIARHNQLGNPATVRAGTRINIPTRWLAFAPSRAQVISVSGDVQYRPYQRNNTRAVAANDYLNMGDVVITGAGSAEVAFADGSTLVIAPHSQILFNKLTAFGPAGMVDTHLRFFQGEGEARVRPQNLGDRFRIQTPEGIAAVRGTVFRVGHEVNTVGADRSRAETLEGAIAFTPKNANDVDLPQGFGAVASGQAVTKESLLPAPDWSTPDRATYAPEDIVQWQAVPGAAAYVVSWYNQSTPNVISEQIQVDDTSSPFAVEPGQYHMQVRAVSKAGLHGFNAQRDVTLLFPAPDQQLVLGADTDEEIREIQLRWTYPSDSTFQVALTTADQSTTYTTSDSHLFLELPPGSYSWQVSAQGTRASEANEFTLAPPPVKALTANGKPRHLEFSWAALTQATQYQVTLHNAAGELVDQAITEGPAYHAEVDAPGTYTFSVTATQNGVTGQPASIEATTARSHWWLLLLALPVLLI